MATVSGTFTTDGLSNVLRMRKTPETVAISVASGWSAGDIVLERSVTASESAWVVALGPFSRSTGFSGVYEAQPMERLRLRARNGFSGSSAFSMSDSDAVVAERRNDNNEVVMRLLQSGDRIYRDLYVDGSLYVGGLPISASPASDTEAGIVELATNAEAIAGTADDLAVTPANLAAAVTTHVAAASATTAGKVELATDLEAAAGADTTRAVTPANLAAAVPGHVPDASSSVKGKVELALDAEAITGTDTVRAVTPANLAAAVPSHVPAASDTVAGKVELATNAEAVTGTDTVRAVTPAALAAAIAAIPSSASPPWTMDSTVRSSGFNAVAGKVYLCDTSGGSFTATLPASPSVNDIVGFVDYTTAFGTNKLTLGRSGNKINEASSDFDLDVSNVSGFFVWTGSTNGWMPF